MFHTPIICPTSRDVGRHLHLPYRKIMGVLLCLSLSLHCGYTTAQGISIMSYNCENTFDTLHDAGYNDLDFIPGGEYRWSRWRMFQKLKDIGKVIMAADEMRPIDIVCLQEVENDTVMTYLTKRTAFANAHYEYVMTHSADPRGIDIAMLYNPFTIRIITTYSIRPNTSLPTRDILYACCLANNRDTLDIYSVHLPSALGGRTNLLNRYIVADALMASTDSLRQIRHNPHIIILGDFNDTPQSKLMRSRFQNLINLADTRQKHLPHYVVKGDKNVRGTYKYQGKWENIDQILISKELFEHCKQSDNKEPNITANIFAPPFLLESDTKYGGVKPHRTFLWHIYHGGISDHLPVVVHFSLNHTH